MQGESSGRSAAPFRRGYHPLKARLCILAKGFGLELATVRPATSDCDANVGRAAARKALLLRVGMDRGAGGALGPIFDDGTFEYIPIPEREETFDDRTYETLIGTHGLPLADFLPKRLARVHPHVDPDFKSLTYGDALPRKRRQLSRLDQKDLLVFYCGLAPSPSADRPRLFIIGYFEIQSVFNLQASTIETDSGLRRRFSKTAHFLRRSADQELVLVKGSRRNSRLFRHALPLGDLRDDLLSDLASFGYQGSIRRAVGHWITGETAIAALDAWLSIGPASIIENGARLFCVPLSAVGLVSEHSAKDLVFAHDTAGPGDWVLACSSGRELGATLLARINRRQDVAGRGCALSSLFWSFGRAVALPPEIFPLPLPPERRTITDTAAIRHVVSWVSRHYRIGRFQDGCPHDNAPVTIKLGAQKMATRITADHVRLKRAYEPLSDEDGARVLVERLWPRGLKKTDAGIDKWVKEIAPSTDLRKWFGHDPVRWNEFRRRYVEELHQHRDELGELRDMAREGPITLIFSTHDAIHNNAVVLRDVLLGRSREA